MDHNNTCVQMDHLTTVPWPYGYVNVFSREGNFLMQRYRIFLLAFLYRPVLGLTNPPIQWVPEVLSQW